MQNETISRLQNLSSTVKTPSPLGGVQSPQKGHNSGQLDNIFNSVKRQIDQWGENAKWKIDLVLLDNPHEQQQQQQLHPLLSPQHLHPNAITAPSNQSNSKQAVSLHSGDSMTSTLLPVTSTVEYPWDYVAPTTSEWRQNSDDLQQKLRESIERQKYLEGVIWSQAEQIKHSSVPDKDDAINTMKSIFLMSQNEQRAHYLLETDLLHKEIETLTKKLAKMASILYTIENTDLNDHETVDKETLLHDRKLLLRKLHLAELRLSARDAEIDYLHNLLDSKSNTSLSPKEKKATLNTPNTSTNTTTTRKVPYLFQQQYSPRSEVRSSEQHPLSGLDSLGIVADQMLSDPEFDSTSHRVLSNEKRLRSRLDDRRSQRSIDSAATLLAMPQLMVPTRKAATQQQPSSSPEQPSFTQHIPKKPRSTYTRWTEAEDALLRKAVKKYGHSNWEACSKDVHGRSNIQCRNRWIRHLEHRIEKEEEPSCNARQSPSIASLLNNTQDEQNYYSPKYETTTPTTAASSSSGTYHPTYRPPSPMATPKGGKRRPSQPNKW
ncbi:uncharacterized protein EV154DRAFT_493427 [Mucor mucedo]|uniref:uncharacterized protein n=1 Tax=Mucor mucedo TaxID=29922 RepID=UPI0022210384|nr:uncharacterized protein EV154DRAFT_493427 [Mucor mucedo]KAI7896071.1 hypothetical protein EV154DRAFT_493427 [Mucor mucedo]